MQNLPFVAQAGQLLGNLMNRGAGAPPPAAPSDSDQEFCHLVDRRHKYARDAKQELLRPWATSLAFYVGHHYRRWDSKAKRLVEPSKIPPWRVMMTDNQIPGLVEMAAAKLARSRQLPRALPNTGEPEDEFAAQAGSKALEHWWHVDGMEQKELEANIGRIIFGASFFHDYWNPNKLARVPVPDRTTGQLRAVRAPVGEACVEVLSVFDVFPEPVDSWDDITWCVIARRKPLHWFAEMFGEAGARVTADNGDAEDVFQTLLPGALAQQRGESAPPGEGMATVKIYYELPCAKYPRGRHAITAGGKLLFRADELPLPHGEIPVSMMAYRWVPKRLWPKGLIEDVIGLQRELNRSQSYMAENLRFYSRFKWLVPREARVDEDAITNAPDEQVMYSSSNGSKPEIVPPPPLPAWLAEYPASMRMAIQHVAGQHEVSNASTPTGVTAGVAIDLLQQQDDTRLAVANILGKRGLEVTARHVLSTIVERYREPRLLLTIGRDRVSQVAALMGADIGDRDVIVDITEGVSDTDAARRQRLLDYHGAGLLNPQVTPPPLAKAYFHALRENWLLDALAEAEPELAQRAVAGQLAMQQLAEQAAPEQASAGASGDGRDGAGGEKAPF